MLPIAAIDQMMQNSTPEQRQAGMEEWKNWQKTHASDVVEMGAPVGRNKRVTGSGVTDTRNEVGGYSIVQAESHDAAAKLFSDNPHFKIPGAYIDIMECTAM